MTSKQQLYSPHSCPQQLPSIPINHRDTCRWMTNAPECPAKQDVRAPPVKLASSRPIRRYERERDSEREIVARPRGLIIHESSVAFDKLFLAVRSQKQRVYQVKSPTSICLLINRREQRKGKFKGILRIIFLPTSFKLRQSKVCDYVRVFSFRKNGQRLSRHVSDRFKNIVWDRTKTFDVEETGGLLFQQRVGFNFFSTRNTYEKRLTTILDISTIYLCDYFVERK